MGNKKVNWMFLSIILLHCIVVVALIFLGNSITFDIIINLIISELLLILPAIIFFIGDKGKQKLSVPVSENIGWEETDNTRVEDSCKISFLQENEISISERKSTWAQELGFTKIKTGTFFMSIVFTFLIMPMTTVINAISMLFVENTVILMSEEMLEVPFILMFSLIALYGPFCEEFVFRGVVYKGYQKEGSTIGAILLSGLLFGLVHMNFNQAGYAFFIGIALAFLVELSGSIWPAVICHVIFNAQSVTLLYVYDRFFPELMEAEAAAVTVDGLLMTISVYGVVAAISTAIAICVGVWIGKNEGRSISLQWNWREEKKRFTVPLFIAIGISLIYMILW
ncbi:MAG: CPBP family intramembrane glutamic endopeptidase [Eubacteriales bacterium]